MPLWLLFSFLFYSTIWGLHLINGTIHMHGELCPPPWLSLWKCHYRHYQKCALVFYLTVQPIRWVVINYYGRVYVELSIYSCSVSISIFSVLCYLLSIMLWIMEKSRERCLIYFKLCSKRCVEFSQSCFILLRKWDIPLFSISILYVQCINKYVAILVTGTAAGVPQWSLLNLVTAPHHQNYAVGSLCRPERNRKFLLQWRSWNSQLSRKAVWLMGLRNLQEE